MNLPIDLQIRRGELRESLTSTEWDSWNSPLRGSRLQCAVARPCKPPMKRSAAGPRPPHFGKHWPLRRGTGCGPCPPGSGSQCVRKSEGWLPMAPPCGRQVLDCASPRALCEGARRPKAAEDGRNPKRGRADPNAVRFLAAMRVQRWRLRLPRNHDPGAPVSDLAPIDLAQAAGLETGAPFRCGAGRRCAVGKPWMLSKQCKFAAS